MKITTFEHIKKSLQRVKGYTSSKISELTNATVAAIEEIENKKADKPQYFYITIPTNGWQSDSNIYPKYYDIVLQQATEDNRADIIILSQSMKVAVSCGFCAISETFSGKVRVRAMKQPISEITTEIILY